MSYAVDKTGVVHFGTSKIEAAAKARQANRESK
jgi:hypothetical protein